MCKHCNNWFTKDNKPPQDFDTDADIPAAFMELAERIAEFAANVDKYNITSESVGEWRINTDLEYTAWQKAFSRELALYKRARFI